MATSPETVPSQSNGTEANPPTSSILFSEAISQLSPSTNSSLLAEASPPEASSPPPPESPPAAPQPSPPPASPPLTPPSSPPPAASAPPPAETTPSAPPPKKSQSPPPDNSASHPPPTSSPPPPTASSPPPAPGSPAAPVFSPPPPGASDSQSPPSPALSHSPPPPRANRSSGSSSPGSTASPPPPDSISIDSGVIVGVVVGGAMIIALLIVCLIWSRRKKKPKYYIDPVRPPPQGSDPYYYATQQFSPHPMEHMVKLPPPPGVMGTPSVMGTPGVMGTPLGGWGVPPPPPPANTSSDFSSGHLGQHPTLAQPPSPNMGGIGAKSQFTYEELATATSGFSQANLLGQGGFGFVHKGILPDGREVAVKSLKSGSGQGEREFQAEVEIISRVHHRHLVSLVGYCIADVQRMLVYEFVPNKTLEFHLHGKGQPIMDWSTRLRIALGSAKGLAYLHEDCHPRIIHRDIKAANILLDFNCEAMVADFGLAKLTSDNYTHVSTRVMGTFGYLAPEYASSGKLTEKSDVFSFGVMLLELITGRRPVDLTNKIMEDSLVDWARPLLTKALEDGNYDELVDPRLDDNYIPHELARMVACAAASIRHSARRRPKMSQVVRSLDGVSSLEDLNDGVKPGQRAALNPNENADAYDTRAYDADMVKFRKMVMSSQDFNSSEYGATSEYGLNPSSSSSDSREMDRTPDSRKL